MARTIYNNSNSFNPTAMAYQDPAGGLGYIIGNALGGMWSDDYNKRGTDKALMDWAMTDEGQKAISQMGQGTQDIFSKKFNEYSNRRDASGNPIYVNPFQNNQNAVQNPQSQAVNQQLQTPTTPVAQNYASPGVTVTQIPASNILGQSHDINIQGTNTPAIGVLGNNYYGVDVNGNPILLPTKDNGSNTQNPSGVAEINVGTPVTDANTPMPTPTDPRLDLISSKARETVGLPEVPLSDKKWSAQDLAKEYITITDTDGKKVVLSLDNGQGGVKTPEQAVKDYQTTGVSAGKFNSQEEADSATKQLRNADILTADINMNKDLPFRQRIDDYIAKRQAQTQAVYPGLNFGSEQQPNNSNIVGNVDVTKQPIVQNPDGTVSTVRSMSTNIDGKEVLLPTVSQDGRILSNQEAIDEYKRTGRNLGVFNTVEEANNAAQNLHLQEQQRVATNNPNTVQQQPQTANNATQQPQTIDTVTQQPLTKEAQGVKQAINNQQVVARTPEQKQLFNNAALQYLANNNGITLEGIQQLAKKDPKAVDALMANFDADGIVATLKSNMALNHIPDVQQGMVLYALMPKLAATQKTINQAESRAYQAMLSQLSPTDFKTALPILNALSTVDGSAAKTWSTAFAAGEQMLQRNWNLTDKERERKEKKEDVVWSANFQSAQKQKEADAKYQQLVAAGMSPQEARLAVLGVRTGSGAEYKAAKEKYTIALQSVKNYETKYKDRDPKDIPAEDKARYERDKSYVDSFKDTIFGMQPPDTSMSNYKVMASWFDGQGAGNISDKYEKAKLAKTAIQMGANQQAALDYLGLTEEDLAVKPGLLESAAKDTGNFITSNSLGKNANLYEQAAPTAVTDAESKSAWDARWANGAAQQEANKRRAEADGDLNNYYTVRDAIVRNLGSNYANERQWRREELANLLISKGYNEEYVKQILNL